MFINRRLLEFARFSPITLVITAIVGIAASAAAVGVAFSLSAVVDATFEAYSAAQPLGLDTVGGPIIATAVFTVLRAALLWVRDQAATWTGVTVKRQVRGRVMNHIFELGPGQRWPQGVGGIQATVVDGVEHLQAYLGFYLPQLVVTLVVPLVLVGFVATKDPWVAVVIASGIAVVPIAQRLWARVLGDRADKHWNAYGAYAARITDSIRGIVTLASLGAADRRARMLADEAEKLREATNANLRASLGISVVTASAMSIGTAGATVLAASRAASGDLAPGDVLLVLFLAVECFRPLQELQSYWHEGFHGISASVGISRILDARPTVADSAKPSTARIQQAPAIALDGVSYRYPDADRDALSDVCLRVPAGATLAVVGRSGAGKSTLVQLLLRDMDPTAGSIFFDEHDVRRMPLGHVRAFTARVAQDVVLMDGTIRENVLFARPGATATEFDTAIRGARVDAIAAVLPRGLDSAVGEAGSLLSGGQRQRVALARALLAQTPMLVLDEATSALDAENEALITAALHASRSVRTTVVIAHRLSTVANADLVAVLDEGRLIEFGPPDELARAGGRWSALLQAHSAGLQGPVSI